MIGCDGILFPLTTVRRPGGSHANAAIIQPTRY